METIRVMRRTIGRMAFVTADSTSPRILGANPKRIAVIFGSGQSGNTFYSVEKMTAAVQGLLVTTNGPPIRMDIQELGELITRPWHVYSDANHPVTFGEVILPDD